MKYNILPIIQQEDESKFIVHKTAAFFGGKADCVVLHLKYILHFYTFYIFYIFIHFEKLYYWYLNGINIIEIDIRH